MKSYSCLILFASLFCFISCDRVIQVDVPNKDDKLVVNSFFQPDSTLAITLYHSEYILDDSDFETVSGATAVLFNEAGKKLDKMTYQGEGIYTSNVKPEPGQSYRIKVSKEGYETVTSRDVIPVNSANIIRFEAQIVRGDKFERKGIIIRRDEYPLKLSIWLKDPPGEDFYEIYGIEKYSDYNQKKDTTYVYKNLIYFKTDESIFHDFYNRDNISNGRYLIFDDALFDGTTTKITLSGLIYFSCSTKKCKKIINLLLY